MDELEAGQRDIIIAHLRRTQTKGCPGCGRKEWDVPGLVGVMAFDDSTTPPTIGGAVTSLVMAICSHCYHAMLFSWYLIKRDASRG